MAKQILSHYGWRPLNLHFLTPPVCPIASQSTANSASNWHRKVITARQSEPWTQKVLLLWVTLQLFKTFLVNIHPHLWFYLPYRFSILCQLTLIKFCYTMYLFRISSRGQVLDGLSWEPNIYLTQFVVLLLHMIVSLNSPTGWIFRAVSCAPLSQGLRSEWALPASRRKPVTAFDLSLLGMFLDIWLVVFAVRQSFQESQICS